MPKFPISSARILLVSQIQGGQLPSLPPCPVRLWLNWKGLTREELLSDAVYGVWYTGRVEKASNTTRWQLYVGGFQHQQQQPSLSELLSSSSLSLMSGFVGCLSRLYVDDLTLQLVTAAADHAGSVQLSLLTLSQTKLKFSYVFSP